MPTLEELAKQAGVTPIASSTPSIASTPVKQPTKGSSLAELAAAAGVKPIQKTLPQSKPYVSQINESGFFKPTEKVRARDLVREVGNIAASGEVAVGNVLGQGLASKSKDFDAAVQSQAGLDDMNKQLVLKIREQKQLGKDTSRLEERLKLNTSVDLGKTVLPTSQMTGGQLGGALGQTAVDALSFGTFGAASKTMKAGQLAQKASPVVRQTLPTALGQFKAGVKPVAVGGAVGYSQDVSYNLQEGKGNQSFKPGLGTLIGAGVPALGTALPAVKNKIVNREANAVKKAASKVEKELFAVENSYQNTRKAMKYSKDANTASRKRIAESDIWANAVDDNGLMRTKQKGGAVDQYKSQTLDGAEGVVRNNLEREARSILPEVLDVRLRQNIMDSGLEGKALQSALNEVDDEIAGLKLRANDSGYIPLTSVHDAKISSTNGINYQTEPFVKSKLKAIAKAYKEVVENESSLPIKKWNDALSPYLKDIELLELLDGKRVKGAKLGKYFSQISGNIIGGAIGGAVGGPVGSAVGTVVGGEVSGRLRSSALKNTLGKGTGISAKKSPIIESAIAESKKPRLMLPAPKEGSPRKSYGSGPVINLPMKAKSVLADELYSKSLGSRNQRYSPPNTMSNIDAIDPSIGSMERKSQVKLPPNREKVLTPEEENAILAKEFGVKNIAKSSQTIDSAMEDGFDTFVSLLKDPKIRTQKVKEAIETGDVQTLKRLLVEKGVMSADDVDQMLYSQEMSGDSVLDAFKNKLIKEDPGLLVGRGNENLYGAVAGFEPEYDENGNITGIKYDAKKGAIGVGLMAGVVKVKGKVAKDVVSDLSKEAKKYKSAEDFVKAKHPNVDLSIYEKDGDITLSKIIVPKDSRGSGMGTKAMEDLIQYADIKGKRILLSPSKDYGASSISRLTDFYKKFGFIENKGRARDFSTRESMIREPKSQLKAEWDKAGSSVSDLFQEAKKYKSAEEFAKAQGEPVYHGTTNESSIKINKEGFKTPEKTGIFTPKSDSQLFGDVTFFTSNAKKAKMFGDDMARERGVSTFGGGSTTVLDSYIQPNAKIAKVSDVSGGTLQSKNAADYKAKIELLKKQGFDGLEVTPGEFVVWNTDKIKTKSQLTDIWNKANKKLKLPPNKKN